MFDYTWVDSQIKAVASVIGSFRNECDSFHFDPSPRFYEALGSDNEKCLQDAASELALHLQLPAVPPVDFTGASRWSRITPAKFD